MKTKQCGRITNVTINKDSKVSAKRKGGLAETLLSCGVWIAMFVAGQSRHNTGEVGSSGDYYFFCCCCDGKDSDDNPDKSVP